MPIKKTIWEARDGTQHPTRDQANTYEDMLDLYKYVDDNHIYCGSSESSVDGQAFGLWLQSNPRIFVKLLPDERLTDGDFGVTIADANREAQRTVPETEGEADRNGDEEYFPDGG